MPTRLILVMGVSGTGKSTIAQSLAQQLNYTFLDADDFHSDEAKKMMADGQAINDGIRQEWISRMLLFLSKEQYQNTNFILAYSGLKKEQRHRFQTLDTLLSGIFLYGDKAVIAQRLNNRAGHFFPEKLLNSQFGALELPTINNHENIELIDINQSVENIINQSVTFLKNRGI
jgi:gluconokinase